MTLITREHVQQMRDKDSETRKTHPEYSAPDEIDELDKRFLQGEISATQYEAELNHIGSELETWFSGQHSELDEIFEPYLKGDKTNEAH